MKKGFLIVIPVLIITIVMFYFGILVYQRLWGVFYLYCIYRYILTNDVSAFLLCTIFGMLHMVFYSCTRPLTIHFFRKTEERI